MREKDHLRDNRKCKIICIKQCSAIFVSLFIFSMFIFIPFAEAAWEPILVPMSKNVPLGFQEGFMLEPNVMLLLDTSGSMTFRTGMIHLPGVTGPGQLLRDPGTSILLVVFILERIWMLARLIIIMTLLILIIIILF